MFSKAIVLMVMGLIIYQLGRGLFSLLYDDSTSTQTVKTLTLRVVLSFVAFGLLFLGFAMGWLQPHAL